MKKSKFFKKILVILSIFAILILALHYIMYKDIKSKNEKISNFEHDLSMQSNRQDYLLSIERTLQNIESNLIKANNSIIPKEGDIKFIEGIESIARRNGLTIGIESLVLQNQKLPSLDLTVLNIKVKTKGGWFGTYTFLAEMESLPFKVKVVRSSFVKTGGEADSPSLWESTLDISVLKYK